MEKNIRSESQADRRVWQRPEIYRMDAADAKVGSKNRGDQSMGNGPNS